MTDTTVPQHQLPAPHRRRFFFRLMSIALRLLLIIILATILGGSAYYGFIGLYQQVITPLQQQRARLDELDAAMATQEAQRSQLETAIAALATADARAATEQVQTQATATAGARHADEQQALQRRVAELEAANRSLRQELDRFHPLATQAAATLAHLPRQLALLHIQNLLLRARVQLVAENIGEARLLLTDAAGELRRLINELPALSPDERSSLFNRVITAEGTLPQAPYVAQNEMESVWMQLDRQVNHLSTP